MKTSTLMLTAFAFGSVLAAPVDPDDEVELVPNLNTKVASDDQDYYSDSDTGYIPIIVIRHQSRFPLFGSVFGNQGSPFDFFGDSDSSVDSSNEEDYGDAPAFEGARFPGFFEQPQSELCGLLCTILRGFQMRPINSTEGYESDNDFDVNNTTYTEKVLPDGTVVKVNRTVISDSSDDGSHFFFQSTSFHNVESPKIDSEEETIASTTEEDVKEPEKAFEEFPEATAEYDEDSNQIPLLDDALNEVMDANAKRSKRSNDDAFFQQRVLLKKHYEEKKKNVKPPPLEPGWIPLHQDTLVNEIKTQNHKRGGLIRIEPDSEFIRENPHTGAIEGSNSYVPWNQEDFHH